MDRFESLTAFTAVADEGGFSAASRRLGIPLATISRRVAELEDHLGARLLSRNTRRVALTEVGQQFLVTCRRVMEELEEGERLASGEHAAPRGELVVSAPVGLGTVYLAPLINAFLAAYPEVDIDLRLTDHVVQLLEDGIDVAIRIAHLPDSTLIAAKLGVIRQVVCASPAFLGQHGTPNTLADVSRFACVSFMALGPSREWTFRTGSGVTRIPIRSRLSVSTAEAAVGAAIAGVGLTRLLCYQAAPPIEAGLLNILLRPFEPEPIPVSLVYPSARLVPHKLKAFIDFITPRMKKKLIFDP